MGKKFIKIAMAAGFSALWGFVGLTEADSDRNKDSEMSSLVIANLEALTQDEEGMTIDPNDRYGYSMVECIDENQK